MTRGALRRLLWTVPTLLALSVLLFWLLSTLLSQPRITPYEAGSPKLPLFVNLSPRSVVDAAQEALDQVAAGGPQQAVGASTLVRLGGAAFPHILPQLDALPPARRARVAVALVPVAERMGVLEPGQVQSAEAAVVFFSRFWQNRAVDFRPSVVRRLARRLRRRGLELRYQDLVELDTYALPELMTELNRAQAEDDPTGVARISRVLSRITNKPWTVSYDASADEVEQTVRRWQAFWHIERPNYTTPDAASRVTEMLVQTRYGRWAWGTARFGIRAVSLPDSDKELPHRTLSTLWLLVASVLGGLGFGARAGVLGTGARLWTRSNLLTLVPWSAALLVIVLVTAWLQTLGPKMAWATLGVFALNAGRVALYQHAATRATAASLPRRVRPRGWLLQRATAISMLGADLSWQLSLVFAVEMLWGLPGLGPLTFSAVRAGDLAWLMALCLCSAFAVAIAQILSDSVLDTAHPGFDHHHRGSGALR